MAATKLIAMHQNKGKSIARCLKDRTDYAKNKDKTNGGELVSSYECNPQTVDSEFALSKSEYLKNTGRVIQGDIIAYQIRQSFKPGEITPEEANKVGYETAMRWTKGNHAFIVATHIDREHIHNHIIYNSTDLNCQRKFKDFFLCGLALQHVSDLVCLENGLSVIKPKKSSERDKRTEYPKRVKYRDSIKEDINKCMSKYPKDMEDLFLLLEEMGYEIKRGKQASIKGHEQKSFLRFKTLGEGYREEDLEKVFEGKAKFGYDSGSNERNTSVEKFDKTEPELDMLLDIQKIIAKGKGPGYERWAKVHNVKKMAQTLLFLEQHDMRDYDKLAEKASEASVKFGEISERHKQIEARMKEINGLKEQIINYAKTKDVYVAYRKSGYSKKFFEANREAITLHKAAIDCFDKIKGPIPKIKDLNAEYNELIKEKKKTYAEYKQARQDLKDYQTAKYNVDQFLKQEQTDLGEQKKKRNDISR